MFCVQIVRSTVLEYDKDGDGKLSPEERKAAIDAVRAKKADE